MSRIKRGVGYILDGVWLGLLAVYAIAGYRSVPFHGDESSLIAMSRDYYHLVQRRDVGPVLYDPEPADPMMQELRLLNGTVGKMAMGLAWDLAGYTVEDLNEPWLWGAGWEYNTTTGHMPETGLLYAARLSSAVLLAISIWAVFALGWHAGGRPAAWAAALIYATTPAVLLNGRRAMMEGSHLAFSALAVLAALAIVRLQERVLRGEVFPRSGRRLAMAYLSFGLLSGLAVASKHPAVIPVTLCFVLVTVQPYLLVRGTWSVPRHLGQVMAAGVVALAVFLWLNPAWWPEPLSMPERVLNMRQSLLQVQVAGYGGYDSLAERVTGLAEQAFGARPQYYEVAAWQGYVGDQVARYDGTFLAGRGGGWAWGALLVILTALGIVAIPRYASRCVTAFFLWWAGLTALALLVATPLAWQRYYLPLQMPLAVIAGAGLAFVARRLGARFAVFSRLVERALDA